MSWCHGEQRHIDAPWLQQPKDNNQGQWNQLTEQVTLELATFEPSMLISATETSAATDGIIARAKCNRLATCV